LNSNEPLIYLKGKVSGKGTGARHLQNDGQMSQRQPVGFIRAALGSYFSDQTAQGNNAPPVECSVSLIHQSREIIS
jgi:hypothetical protein